MYYRLLCLLLLLSPIPVTAGSETHEKGPNRTGITLAEALAAVLEHNPSIQAADYETGIATARIRSEQLSKPYRTSIELENFAGSGELDGTAGMETTLSLSKVLEFGDKAELRGAVAQGQAGLLQGEQAARQLDLFAETANNFIHVVVDQSRLDITGMSLDIANRTREAVATRVNAGKSAKAELRKASIEVARKQLAVEHAEHELQSSRVRLAVMWSETRPGFDEARADIFDIEKLMPFEDLVELLDRNPELVRYATQERLNHSRVKLASSRSSPDVVINGGVRHMNSSDDTALVFSLDIPLSSSSRSAPYTEQAKLAKMRDPYLLQKRRLELYSTLFEVYQEALHTITEVDILRDTIIPEAEKVLQEIEKGYLLGRYSLLELTTAQNELTESRLELLSAASNYHQFRFEIDRLTGATFVTGAEQ